MATARNLYCRRYVPDCLWRRSDFEFFYSYPLLLRQFQMTVTWLCTTLQYHVWVVRLKNARKIASLDVVCRFCNCRAFSSFPMFAVPPIVVQQNMLWYLTARMLELGHQGLIRWKTINIFALGPDLLPQVMLWLSAGRICYVCLPTHRLKSWRWEVSWCMHALLHRSLTFLTW